MKKEKNTEKEINEVQEDQLEDVSGGGILSAHSTEDYIRACVAAEGEGAICSNGYHLIADGESLSTSEANMAVRFFKRFHRPAANREEITQFIKDPAKTTGLRRRR